MPRRKYALFDTMAQRTLPQDIYRVWQDNERLEISAQSKDHIANSLMMAVCVTDWVSLSPSSHPKQQQKITERMEVLGRGEERERISILYIVDCLSIEEKIRMWKKKKETKTLKSVPQHWSNITLFDIKKHSITCVLPSCTPSTHSVYIYANWMQVFDTMAEAIISKKVLLP